MSLVGKETDCGLLYRSAFYRQFPTCASLSIVQDCRIEHHLTAYSGIPFALYASDHLT